MVKWQGCIDILDTEGHINFSHYCDKMPGRRISKENSFYWIYSSCLLWWRKSGRAHVSEELLTSQQVRKQIRLEAGKFYGCQKCSASQRFQSLPTSTSWTVSQSYTLITSSECFPRLFPSNHVSIA